MCILLAYRLLKVASHYDFCILSMPVIGFQQKEGWIGFAISIHYRFGICINFAKSLKLLASP